MPPYLWIMGVFPRPYFFRLRCCLLTPPWKIRTGPSEKAPFHAPSPPPSSSLPSSCQDCIAFLVQSFAFSRVSKVVLLICFVFYVPITNWSLHSLKNWTSLQHPTTLSGASDSLCRPSLALSHLLWPEVLALWQPAPLSPVSLDMGAPAAGTQLYCCSLSLHLGRRCLKDVVNFKTGFASLTCSGGTWQSLSSCSFASRVFP